MKTTIPPTTLPDWPYGVSVELAENGVLLKPKPKPRQSWAKEFRSARASDETADLRRVTNKFDHQEWEW